IVAVVVPTTPVKRSVSGPVHCGSPPTAPSGTSMIVKAKPPHRVSIAHSPSCPGIVVHTKSPCSRSGVVVSTIPGSVVIAGTIHHCRAMYVGSQVSLGISHVYILGCHVIDIYIAHIV